MHQNGYDSSSNSIHLINKYKMKFTLLFYHWHITKILIAKSEI